MSKCKECGIKFTPQYSSLEPCCGSFECRSSYAIKVAKKNREKLLKEDNKAWKERKAKVKEKLKKLSDYESEAKKSFQKWVRKRDENLPCISCGTLSPSEWHGSHFYEAGKYSGMIFNPNNCHKSCDKCNVFLSGNLLEYRKGLIDRYGLEYVNNLDELSCTEKFRKYTKDELIEIKKKYNNLFKEYI